MLQFDPRRDSDEARGKKEEITSIKISDINQIGLDSKFSFPVRKSTYSCEEEKKSRNEEAHLTCLTPKNNLSAL